MAIEQMVSVPIQIGFGGNVKMIDVVPGRTRMLDVQTALLAEKSPHTIVLLSTAPAATGASVALTSVAELLHHHERGVAMTATYMYEEKRLAANTMFYTRESDEYIALTRSRSVLHVIMQDKIAGASKRNRIAGPGAERLCRMNARLYEIDWAMYEEGEEHEKQAVLQSKESNWFSRLDNAMLSNRYHRWLGLQDSSPRDCKIRLFLDKQSGSSYDREVVQYRRRKY